MVVHNETATGVTSDVAAVRRAIDAARHPALLYVDGVSSFASIDFRMDAWGVDLAITGSQKGLMLPAGLGIVCASQKALAASKTANSITGDITVSPAKVVIDFYASRMPSPPKSMTTTLPLRTVEQIVFVGAALVVGLGGIQ